VYLNIFGYIDLRSDNDWKRQSNTTIFVQGTMELTRMRLKAADSVTSQSHHSKTCETWKYHE
jgi:hypothetical protein